MDDFNMHTLFESKNEWSARLVTILAPTIAEGYKSMLNESIDLCKKNKEMEKYLMTFQNFISRVPKWNATIIENERKRICEVSGCTYLEDLITCVHVIQLKVLTAMRVGQKQKKIDIRIPKLDDFIHKVYINSARKIYKNVYLFEIKIAPLNIQKNERELEKIIQECIIQTIRDGIPIEEILKAYMAETSEEVIEPVQEPPKVVSTATQDNVQDENVATVVEENISVPEEMSNDNKEKEFSSSIRFNDIDQVKDENNKESSVSAPKSIEYLSQKMMEIGSNKNDDYEDDKITIHSSESTDLPELDIISLD